MTSTRNTPIEAFERAFPMRVLRYRLRRGSGGEGVHVGGEGIERDALMLEDVTVSLITERRSSAPWGLDGGAPGAVGENWLLPGGDQARAERLRDRCTVQLRAGDVLRMLARRGRPGTTGRRPLDLKRDRGLTVDCMTVRFDHANVSVRDVDATITFLQTAFPDFRIRGGGTSPMGGRWVHVGNDDAYLALNEALDDPAEPWVPYAGKPGVNHLGFEVDDVAALQQRLRAAGYRETTVPNAHPARTRVYFNDHDGNDWEFVEYHTADAAQRHDYSDAG